MARGVTISTWEESRADCTNQGQESRPAACCPTISGPARFPLKTQAVLGAPRVRGTLQPQSQRASPSHSQNLQSARLLSPGPVFVTQTHHPNLPPGNVGPINFRAFQARLLLSSLFLSCSFQLRGEAVSFPPKAQPLSLVLKPLPHLQPLKILFRYPVSLTFSLSLPYFLLLGSKIVQKDILTSISSKKNLDFSYFLSFYLLPNRFISLYVLPFSS